MAWRRRCFGFGVPVAAIELKEDRGVGDGHVGLDDEDAEELGRLVEPGMICSWGMGEVRGRARTSSSSRRYSSTPGASFSATKASSWSV